jgi:hypothetical protein
MRVDRLLFAHRQFMETIKNNVGTVLQFETNVPSRFEGWLAIFVGGEGL